MKAMAVRTKKKAMKAKIVDTPRGYRQYVLLPFFNKLAPSFRVWFFCTVLGVGLNPTPMDVGLSPMLVFPTVLGVGLNPTPCHHRIQRKIYGVPKWPIDLGFL